MFRTPCGFYNLAANVVCDFLDRTVCIDEESEPRGLLDPSDILEENRNGLENQNSTSKYDFEVCVQNPKYIPSSDIDV